MAVKFSNPVRKNDQGILLPQIPPEIYVEILSYTEVEPGDSCRFTFTSTLSRIASVYRYFFLLVAPRRFDTLTFQGAYLSSAPAPNYTEFCRSIVSNERRDLAEYVRTCFLYLWGSLRVPAAMLYFSAMVHMPNLVNLYILSYAITSESLRAISKLTQLRGLRLDLFSVEDGCTWQDLQQLKALKPTSPKLSSCLFLKECSAFAEAFDYTNLVTLQTCFPASVRKIQQSESPLVLRELILSIAAPGNLHITPAFFRRLPELRKLRYDEECGSIFDDLDLDPTYIPHLETLSCKAAHLATFAPQRPLSAISIYTESQISISSSQLQPLAQSKTRFTYFKMPCKMSLLRHGSDYLSKVDCLWLCDEIEGYIEGRADTLEEIINALPWSKIPHMQEIHLTGRKYSSHAPLRKVNLRKQYDILQRIPTHASNLTVVELGDITWTRDAPNGSWSPEFKESYRQRILADAKNQAERGLEYVSATNDHNDYMKNLVTSLHVADGDTGSET